MSGELVTAPDEVVATPLIFITPVIGELNKRVTLYTSEDVPKLKFFVFDVANSAQSSNSVLAVYTSLPQTMLSTAMRTLSLALVVVSIESVTAAVPVWS